MHQFDTHLTLQGSDDQQDQEEDQDAALEAIQKENSTIDESEAKALSKPKTLSTTPQDTAGSVLSRIEDELVDQDADRVLEADEDKGEEDTAQSVIESGIRMTHLTHLTMQVLERLLGQTQGGGRSLLARHLTPTRHPSDTQLTPI